jgi:hypothetical protein
LSVEVDDRLDTRQMRRQRTTVQASLLRPGRAFRRRAFLSVRRRVGLGLLDVFEREQQLIFRQALGAPSEAMALNAPRRRDEARGGPLTSAKFEFSI